MKIILSESQYKRLFEYHAQQRLPFKDEEGNLSEEFAIKKNTEEFMDWIEEFGKVGTLPNSKITFEEGVKSGLAKAIEWSINKYDISRDDVKDRLYKKLAEHGFYDKSKKTTKCVFNKNGNMYVERAITLKGKADSINGDKFETYVDRYQDNVGGCWCWKKDIATSYCSHIIDGFEVILKGYIRLEDIDWVETDYINSYDANGECEIRVKPNAKIELFEIYAVLNKYKFPLDGRHIIVSATYFGNNGEYGKDGYANVYNNTSDSLMFRNRSGDIMNIDEMLYDKIEQLKQYDFSISSERKKALSLFRTYGAASKNQAILSEKNKYFIYDFVKREVVGNIISNYCKWLNSEEKYYISIDNKGMNLMSPNGELEFERWYTDYSNASNGVVFVKDASGKWGVLNKQDEYGIKFLFDYVQDDLYEPNSYDDEFAEVYKNGLGYNLVNAKGEIASKVWFPTTDYYITYENGIYYVVIQQSFNEMKKVELTV